MDAAPTQKVATGFIRLGLLQAKHPDLVSAQIDAETSCTSTPAVERVLRAAVAAGSLDGWGSQLTDYKALASGFVSILRPRTIIGRIENLARRAPARQRIIVQTVGATATWTAANEPKALTALGFEQITAITPKKCTAIVVLTDELVRAADSSSIEGIQRDLIAALSTAMNSAFIDPGSGATSARPGSITHADSGAVAIPSSGSTVGAITTDLKAAAEVLIDAGSDLSSAVWVMHPRTATFLSAMRGANGEVAFPGLGARGGELLGLPVIVSAACAPAGSPSEVIIALVDAARIVLVDDGVATISSSRHASVQMLDNPASGAAQLRSMWQANLSGLLCERFIEWRALDGAVAYITGVNY